MKDLHESLDVTAHIVNGFVAGGAGGNPAGVVLDADRFTEQQMLEISKKIGLSETAFVSASDTAGFKLDFFTPNRRIAHCGHATIAAFSYLAQTGRVGEGETSKMTVDGPRKIIIRGEQAFMEQTAPSYRSADNWGQFGVTLKDVLDSVGLSSGQLIGGLEPMLINTGNSFIVIPVKDEATLAAVEPDQDVINQISEKLDLIGYYLFAMSPNEAEAVATTRMFGPRYAIIEEAATGMAAGPLGCYLYDVMDHGDSHLIIAQGHFMKPASPSLITVDLVIGENGKISSLTAGGFGKSMREVQITLD